ncbi:titin-like isoform X6 [Scylla paramamosain]|uniref:titin-like isoform X6 n=1 Tax=Scylla paramamosain TaxID=85552 RepID=UPI003083A7BB
MGLRHSKVRGTPVLLTAATTSTATAAATTPTAKPLGARDKRIRKDENTNTSPYKTSGNTPAGKTGSAQKNKGPAAAGGLGGPPPSSEGQREAVITQENTGNNSPPLSPASTHSEASLPGLSQECDTASGEDTTPTTTTASTPCVTCVSELPSSASEAPHTQPGAHHHSLGNSASESVSQSVTQNGVEKDSEYESAEELDSPHHSSPEEAPQAPSTSVLPEAEGVAGEEFAGEDSAHPPLECLSDGQTEAAFPSSVVNAPLESDQTVGHTVNGVESDAVETVPVISDTTTTTTTVPVSVSDTAPVTNGESEPPVSTVCESVVTLTKNEVVEESVVENTVLVDQQVIAATHPTPEIDRPVDVSEINLELVTSGDNSNTDSCEPPVCVSVDVSEAKETSDQATPSGESERVLEPPTDQVTEESCVPEASQETSRPEDSAQPPAEESIPTPQEPENLVQEKQEDTLQSSGEETAPIQYQETEYLAQKQEDIPPPLQQESTSVPHQETEHSLEEKQEASQDTTDSPVAHIAEQHTTPEEAVTEHKEESPPPIPPPDPDDIPIAPKKGYNLDFLDYLDDPDFNPFASKTAIRNTPPPSPEPGVKLPPLKPAIKKKGKKTAQAATNQTSSESTVLETNVEDLSSVDKPSDSFQPSQDSSKVPDTKEETDQKEKSVLEISLDDSDTPKTPAKPLRKPPQRRPLKKPRPKPEVTEKNNNRVEKEDENTAPKDDNDIPIPPSKGYNLDFLDNLDDPNFNPFASKTAVRNSPTEGAAFPASRSSPEKAEEPKPKVTVARKTSPKKGFTVPRKDSGVKSDSPQPSENSVSQADKKQEPVEVPEPCKPEPSPVEVPKEENEEELPLPKKGYNLDFLDDPNFDPFQTRSSVGGKAQSGAKSGGDKDAASAVIEDVSAKVVASKGEPETVVNRAEVPGKETVPEDYKPEPSQICVDKDLVEPESQGVADSEPACTEETPEPKNQLDETPESCVTKDVNQTNQTANQNQESSPLPDSENNWSTEETESTEPHLGRFKTPSIGTIGQLDSLEFDQLLEHEASRIAEEFMNCSRDSGLADYDESSDNHYSTMADTSYSNLRHVDENINPFQKSSQLAHSPPLGKRGAVCGAEADSLGLPFSSRRSLKRDIVMGEERLDTSSLEDDSGIVLGSRSDLETEVNHSEAGPEIATGLTSSDLRCASQFFKEATDLETHLRRNLVSPLLGSHSKLSGDVTPTKDKKEPPAGAPESPQNKPAPSTSSPAPPPREERSAPEGTSSPSPRPSDTAERKSLSTRPTSAPPEGYMTASEVQELLKRQELKFEEKLLRVELAAGEKEKKLQQTMKDEQKEMATLGSSVAELTQSRDALLKMVAQYKGMLATLVTEKEKEKKTSDEKISALEGERDQALEDLANVEVAFSDVHRKYERTKQVVDTLKRNEETLRGAVADYEAKLKKQEQKFLEFQKHAEEKIQMANEEFENMRKSNEQEMTKMAALLKKAEMKIMSLQDSFDRKTRENQELTQLCDDLINKVGTSH